MKKWSFLFLFFTMAIMISNSCQMTKKQVDVIIINAKVYTVDSDFSISEAFAVKDGKFLEVGKSEMIMDKYSSETVLDMKGKIIYPGFIDPHCHFWGYCENLKNVDLAGTESVEEIIEKLKEHDEKYNPEWILGRGWDQNDWEEKEFPTKEMLDMVFPDKPVYLRRIDGHAAWINSKAMDMAGITADTEIEGGDIILSDGSPRGILIDNAMSLVGRLVPETSFEQMKSLLVNGQNNCFAVGLTSVGDAGLGYKQVKFIEELQNNGALNMRIYAMLSPTKQNLEEFIQKGSYKTDYLNVQSVKLFADGALGSRGACMLEPYSDDQDNYGLIVEDIDVLRKWCEIAYENAYQVNTHCIGDSANRLMLNLYGEFLKGENDRRWRIEHAQIIHPDDFQLFKKYSVVPSVQTVHATSDMYWADERVGEERLKGAYAYKTLLNQLGWLPNGSDFPVEQINPLFSYYAAIARKDQSGYPEEGFQTEEALTRKQALKGMTIWAAKAAFEENEKGSIEKGKMADFVVMEEDLLECDIEKTFKAKVLETYSNGVKVH